MVLEPNCSIFAACLPTLGPLISGGRAPESIVRSVRSIFSLRSLRGSGGSSGSSRPGRRNYVQHSEPDHPKDNNLAESQVELRGIQKMPAYGEQEVVISGHQSPQAELSFNNTGNEGIYITNGVTVERE